jgi:hypothetical protein
MSDAFFEPDASLPFDPADVFTRCVEAGAPALLLDSAAFPPEFFDLSTGIAGELLHKLSTYRIRLAGVVPDPSAHSERFAEFVRESNRGSQFRFFETREQAVAWLESGRADSDPA